MADDKTISTSRQDGDKEVYDSGAQRDSRIGKGRFDLISPYAMRVLARVSESGVSHYGARNWERGMPASRFLDSLQRHINRALIADPADEDDHWGQALWNLAAIVHFRELKLQGDENAEKFFDLPG